jgi:hypothetical protein
MVLVKADLRNIQVLVAMESTDYDEWGSLVVVTCDQGDVQADAVTQGDVQVNDLGIYALCKVCVCKVIKSWSVSVQSRGQQCQGWLTLQIQQMHVSAKFAKT